jgi:SOS-response transcriptional repressor LexA
LERWQLQDAVRLRTLFTERAKVSQEKFGQAHGIGTQGAVWQYLEGRIPLNIAVALKFSRGLDVPLREISPTLADQVEHQVGEPLQNYDAGITPGPDIRGEAPLISWVRAGEFDEATDNFHVGDAEDWFPMPKRAGPHTYCLRVEGDSMTAPYGKTYPAGCVIFVDPDLRAPANGARVIAKLEGSAEVTFKVFVQEAGRIFLRPLNPQYPPIYDAFKVIGTVIGKWEDE